LYNTVFDETEIPYMALMLSVFAPNFFSRVYIVLQTLTM